MTREGNNDNDEYYVPIQTRSCRIIVNIDPFVQAATIALGLLTFQFHAFLQNSQPGSIETIKNELENVSIFKSTMDHIYLISRNSDDGSINLVDPRILAEETSQKDNLHLREAMKATDSEDFMTVMEKEIKDLTKEDVWEIIPKSLLPTSAHIIQLL